MRPIVTTWTKTRSGSAVPSALPSSSTPTPRAPSRDTWRPVPSSNSGRRATTSASAPSTSHPVEHDYGYDYGLRGTGQIVELGDDEWTARLRVYGAEFIHLDGRITERRYGIEGAAYSGDVLLTVSSSFTVEGRDEQEVIDLVGDHVTAFFGRLRDRD